MYGFIYITTNLVNNKKYLGFCSYHKKNYKSYLGSGKALKRAIKKYGRENFSREIIYIAQTKEELSIKEQELIMEYNCVESPEWYNIAFGGYTTRGFTGKKHSDETKEKMKKSYKRVLTDQGRLNIANATRQRVKEIRKKQVGAKHWRSKPVMIDGIHYVNITEAYNKTGIPRHRIRKLANLNTNH